MIASGKWLVLLAGVLSAAPALRAQAPGAADSRAGPLSELVAEALKNSPEISAARNEWDAARHRISPAGALEDPMLEAGLLNVPASSWSLRREDMTMKMLGISQKLPYPGKRDLRRGMAAKDAEAVGLAFRETSNRVVRDVRVAYYDLALAIASARVVERNIAVIEQFLKIAESRYSVGQGNQADVFKAQTQRAKMQDELLKLGRERPALEAELSRALGRSSAKSAPLPEPLRLQEKALDLEALQNTAFSERPQLLALQRIAERNEKALDLARKDSLPDFDLRFSYGQRDNGPEGLRREDMVSLTIAINLPVQRESKIEPRIAEAASMRYQAIDMYNAQRNEASAKLRQQVAAAEQSLKSARLYETGILPQARLGVESSLSAYRVNRVDFLSLLDTQMTVFNLEIAHAAAIAGYNKALAEIDLITGKPGTGEKP